jgi:general secretion pathway protein H
MTSCQPKHVSSLPAFTLVEVLVVIVIMGIAGAVVVPQMLNAGTLHVQAAARSIISDILVAQNEAVVRQSTRQIVFNTQANEYTLTDSQGNAMDAPWGHAGKYVVNFTKDMRFAHVRIENVAFGADESTQNTLSFNELGEPSNGGTIDVVSGTTGYRITVTPFTGKVTIGPVPETSGG